MLTPVTLLGMDDKPAIEYHPYGTITLNFDDGPVKLRRCRLGDLQYAQDSYDGLLPAFSEKMGEIQADAAKIEDLETPEGRKANRVLMNRTYLTAADLIGGWLTGVAQRMGDKPLPPMEDWPMGLLSLDVVRDVLGHWTSRPLNSGRISQNGMIPAPATSEASKGDLSSPPGQL